MHRTIRRELTAAALAAFLFTAVLLGLTVPGAVERSLRTEQQRALLQEAELAARLAAEPLARAQRPSSRTPWKRADAPPAHSQLQGLARELDRALGAGTVIVDRGGAALAGASRRA